MIQKCNLTPDKFGYYQIGEQRTYSKMEALELQKHTGYFPEWKFNQEIFSAYNWKQEPQLDLWQLYKLRAQQIRDTYDYVVLFYSGGSDSQNLLAAWLDQGCKIDEIATQWNYSATQRKMGYWNGEVNAVVLPWIDELKKRGIEFKFRLLDVSEDTRDAVDLHHSNYEYITNCNLSPNNHAKNLWRKTIDDYRNRIAAGQKVCFVWGSEKPFFYWDKKHYIIFQDIIDNCVNPYVQQNYNQGWYDELFYWTPDMPELVSKQAHVLRRFVENVHDLQFYQKGKTRFGYNRHINMWLTEEAVKTIIYPKWDPNTYVDGKPGINVVSWRDQWLINGNLEQGKIYQDIIQSLGQRIDTYWLNSSSITKGLKNNISERYYIE